MKLTRVKSAIRSAVVMLGVGLVGVSQASAQAPKDFYRGKTVTIVVGYAVGGGYDAYARLLSRHLGDHIPGKPDVIVQNMPGAASLAAANYVYSVAPQDGTVIAAVDQNTPMFQFLGGKGVHYDVQKAQWLGDMSSSNGIVMTWYKTGLKNLKDVLARPVSMGTTGGNDDAYVYGETLNALIGTKFTLVQGYPGTAAVNLAMEDGEVESMTRSSYYGFASQRPDWLRDHKVNIVIQLGFQNQPQLAGVPLLQNLVKTDEQRHIADMVTLATSIGYAHWVAPDVPEDRVKILRDAYAATLRDPALLADAKTVGLDITPESAAHLEALILRTASSPKAIREKAALMLHWN
jgi:hypothetical protein